MTIETHTVQSQTNPKLTYVLHVNGEQITCSCRGYETYKRCKHQEAMRLLQEEYNVPETTALTNHTPPLPVVADTPPTALLPTTSDLNAMVLISQRAVAATGMIPANIKTPDQALAVMLAGWELGLRPMTALRHIYTVNGKTEIETRAMVGIIRARDPRIQFNWPEYTRERVRCQISRPGQPVTDVVYTVDDAKASGQYKPGVWTQYTRDMLYAAATKRACRLACPDLINAIESGLQHTVAEAESYTMPPTQVRVIDPHVSDDVLADAYNEGDAEIPAEVQAEIVDYKSRVKDLILEAKDTWDKDAYDTLINGAIERFPVAFKGRVVQLSTIDDPMAQEFAEWLQSEVRPQPELV